MLMTVADFRQQVGDGIERLVDNLQELTGRSGVEEAAAWRASLPKLAEALSAPMLAPLHVYFGGAGYLALEYQLPAAGSWCDAVLLGRSQARPAAVVVELKDWITRGDRPGPCEGLIHRSGQIVLHPSDQVRGYVEYCRRFHSTVQDHSANVEGCVLFTRDHFAERYGDPPNDHLVREYPCFTMRPVMVREALPAYLVDRVSAPDVDFARAFVTGRYRQDRGFVRQIGAQILAPERSPFVLLDHQRRAYAMVQDCIERHVLGAHRPRRQVILIEGPPGSGKSVLAARLWARLVTDDRLPAGDVVLTTTSTAQTSNWSKLLAAAGRARAGSGVVKRAASYVPITTQTLGRLRTRHGRDLAADPAAWRENVKLLRDLGVGFQDGARDDQYQVSIIDEAHALINPEHAEGRGQFGFAPTLGPLAWHIIRASSVSVFLLDADQGFRDRENTRVEDIQRWAAELGAEVTDPISLAGAQFRCAGSTEYVAWVESVLRGDPPAQAARLAKVWRQKLAFDVLDTPADLESVLRKRTASGSTVRLLASYARAWKTKGAANPHGLPPHLMDFHERYVDAGRTRYWSKVWNFVPQGGSDYTWFIQAPPGSPLHDDPLCEVGCPYAVRGFDFDYAGVLWLNDLVRRGNRWQVVLDHVHDTGLASSLRIARRDPRDPTAQARLRRALGQAYRILLTRGLSGCYLWFEDSETRRYVARCLGG
jgi:hypothetical protein